MNAPRSSSDDPPSGSRPYAAAVRCCYLGMFIQAMVINLTPLLFIPLKLEFGLTFEQLGRLVLINFLTQMLVDLACTAVVDRFGLVKPLTVAAQVLAAVGLVLFGLAPGWFPGSPYTGLVLGTVVFSIGCGLLEVLISPILQAVPSRRKAGEMALLHAFYPIGKVAVIAVTAALLHVLPQGAWVWIALGWAVVPVLNTAAFLAVRLPPFVHESQRHRARRMAGTGSFWLVLAGMLLAGATEVTFAQWTSAFAQAGLGWSQGVADWVGFGLFGVMMIAGRLWFGWRGEDGRIRPILIAGAAGSALCYLAVAFSPWPAFSLAACVIAGGCVSMLWPGLVSLGAARFPKAGVSLFALMAAFGDTGAGAMPWLVGWVADRVERAVGAGALGLPDWIPEGVSAARFGLQSGLFVAALAPIALIAVLAGLREPRQAEEGPRDPG